MSHGNSNSAFFPGAAAACLAASVLSFLVGQARGRRRQRPCHAARGDDSFNMLPQLADDKHEVVRLQLCTVLLMDDARYPAWLVLVPRQNNMVEVIDLPEEAQAQLWREVAAVSAAVRKLPGVKKLNVAAIGNICSQLHVHITGRFPGDAAWPGPCYGVGTAEPFEAHELQNLLTELRRAVQQQS